MLVSTHLQEGDQMEWSKRQGEIITQAINLIAEKGIQEFTTKNLAALLSISEAAIYRHFSSKTEIMSNIIDYLEFQSMSLLESMYHEGLNPLEKVSIFVHSRFVLFSIEANLAYIMFNENIFQNDQENALKMTQMMRKHQKSLFENINLAKEQGLIRNDLDNETLFLILIGPTRLLINQWFLNQHSFDLVERGELLCKQLEKILINKLEEK